MAGTSAGVASGVVAASFFCIALALLGIVAAIVLSLISTYTPNHSEEGYGEEYRCDALMLKTIYENTSYTFSNSTIADNPTLSTYCTAQITNKGVSEFAGCLLENGVAFGPYNTSTSSRRRRRANPLVGLYSIHDGRLFFSSKCPKKADHNKTDSSSGLSACVAQRLAIVNNLVNNYSANFILWTPTPSFVLSIVSTDLQNYRVVSPSMIYGVPRGKAAIIAQSLGEPTSVLQEFAYGCRYVGGLSMAAINAILASQALETTTPPTSNAPQ